VRLLSIGTTTSQFSFSHAEGRNYGFLKWATGQKLIQTIISSQQSIVDFMIAHKLPDRYLRIDALQSKEQERDLALDVATLEAQRTIRGLAEGSVRESINSGVLTSMLENTAPSPRFFHSI